MKLLLFLLPFAGAMVCPPVDKDKLKANLKGEGEPCGGACDSLGWCADGLECVVPKTSSMSFAILLTPARSGICRGAVEEDTPTNAPVPGGISTAEVDEAVMGAARFCIEAMNSQSNSLTPPTLSRVVSATKQVVVRVPCLSFPLPPSAPLLPHYSPHLCPPPTSSTPPPKGR